MPKLTPKELEFEMEEMKPVFIFPPIFDIPFIDGIGDEMEIGFSETDICLPGYEILFG